MSQNIKPTFIFIMTLGILSMLPPFGVDMYLPSFLEIAKDLKISPEQVQHTLTAFAYGMAFGQLFWGPFGDSFGRKPIILLGVIIGAITALVLTEINSIGNFTALRFVQGFFGAAPVVLSGALLRDLFRKNELSKVISTITLVFMIAPLVAPIIGGYIVKYFHWHAIFYVIALMGALSTLLVFFIIPETHKKENRIPLRLNIIARNFMSLWKQKEVLGYMFAASFGFGGLFAFVTAGSIVYIGIYGIPVDQFGYFFMLNIAIMTLASFLNGQFVTKIGAETMLRIGIAIQFLSGVWLILTALFDFGFWSMAIGVAFFVGQNPLISSNAMASILEKFPTISGTVNSLVGSVRFATGAVMGSLVATMKMDTAAPMLFTMGACVIIAVLAYYFLTYRNLKR
ncbi:Bcr/CflA family multidrug efflux MFS transporter [Rodentibacter pneumotropicus]|uniref:Bcr/CflA family multidrug efflux MFS transporter n=1 Tax=Rodentibacter pneumotropicus TaxID=758 RepID=UPI0009860209|nr:Bcr/CflA family multidrug efflux MFS transporter [Rodentibacter pneumotropicus]OOF63503.1 Bcr/CflA family drug resistance efflux transporter [Rodentibacter pneumotropicus]THA17798.1 Bcr/CflA family drug resistance efflux transporter [Rodentibacter pneumotropicus]